MNQDSLSSTNAPWFGLMVGSRSTFTDLLWAVKARGSADSVVVRLRGSKMQTYDGLFDEMGAAFQFPDYFGENWAALEECLCDLDWLPAPRYVVGISDAAKVLSANKEGFAPFVALLTRACESWGTPVQDGEKWDRPAVPFHVLFQCEEGEQTAFIRRFAEAGGHLVSFESETGF